MEFGPETVTHIKITTDLLNRLHFMLLNRLTAANQNPVQRKFYENTTDEILKFMLAARKFYELSTAVKLVCE